MAESFVDYPLLTHAYEDRDAREKAALFVCQHDLYCCERYGVVHATSPNLEGVAAWAPSSCFPLTPWRTLTAIPLSAIIRLHNAPSRLKDAIEHADSRRAVLAPYPHWFLALIGVAPELQGQGNASKLLRPMLESADARGMPVYLETMDGRNVSLYEHFGFQVVEESAVPDTNLRSWAMARRNLSRTR